MREIKFRAWDTKTSRYLNPWGDEKAGFHLFGETMCFDLIGQQICDPEKGTYLLRFNDLVIEQYTGLKDVNGKEIYEGDWLRFSIFDYNGSDTQYHGCVVFTGTRFMIWNQPDNEFYGSDGGFDLDDVYMQDDEIEIIGNLHETPELLEEK